jgi:superfamily II DNA or RNA helicase
MNEIDIIDTFFDEKDVSKISKLSVSLRSFIINTSRMIIDNSSKFNKADIETASLILEEGTCIARSNTRLKDYQVEASKYLMRPDISSLLLHFDTGTGKTLTALTISQCFLDENPESNVIVISPSKLKENFEREVKNYGGKLSENYRFYSFTSFLNASKHNFLPDPKDCLLIVDEVHNLRNPKSAIYSSIMEYSITSKKRLLLTATPLVNDLQDLICIINLLKGKYVVGTDTTKTVKRKVKIYRYENIHKITTSKIKDPEKRLQISVLEMYKLVNFLRNNVMRIKKPISENFPSYDIHTIFVDMSPEYTANYNKILEDYELMSDVFTGVEEPHAFYNVVRRAVNKAGSEYYSEKIDFILPKIEIDRTIIYTNWNEFGSNILRDVMKKHKVKYDIIDSKTRNVKKIVDDYNTGKLNVLIITKAGSEGIDLKGTRNVIVLDPVWNPAGLEQIIGRAVRYNSHIDLPQEDRHVNIFLLILKEYNKTFAESISGDVILYKIIKRKKALLDEFNKMIDDISII